MCQSSPACKHSNGSGRYGDTLLPMRPRYSLTTHTRRAPRGGLLAHHAHYKSLDKLQYRPTALGFARAKNCRVRARGNHPLSERCKSPTISGTNPLYLSRISLLRLVPTSQRHEKFGRISLRRVPKTKIHQLEIKHGSVRVLPLIPSNHLAITHIASPSTSYKDAI